MTLRVGDLAAFEGLALQVRRGRGDRPGERRFPGRLAPSGIELEGHARYAPGDDLRHLDWNALGRLDTLLVRRFVAEREVVVHVLVDCSASMGTPPRDRKLAVASDLALALAFIALSANDAVRLALLPGAGPSCVAPVFRQRASTLRVAELLDAVVPAGPLALGAALAAHARRHPNPGLAIVVSDLMADPVELETGLLALGSRGYEVVLLHVIGRAELEPARHFSRGLLRDVESGRTHPVVLTPAALARYRALLDDHVRALVAVAARTRATYARLASDESVLDFVAVELARLGVVRRR